MTLTEFRIGSEVRCADGECGHMTEVVVDARTWTATHLLVEPAHRSGLGRLVPLDLVGTVTVEIGLACTRADFEKLELGERTDLLPGSNGGYGGYGLGQAVPGAYVDRSSFGVVGGGVSDAFDPVVDDTLPLGEVTVRSGPVRAVDGDIGRVRGVGLDPDNHRLIFVFLEEGHLWGRKRVAIPVGAVSGIDDGVRMNLTKAQIEALPPLDDDGA